MGILYENRNKACYIKRRESLEYVAHIHKEIEIVYMLSGQSKAFLDSAEYVLNEGDLFVCFPNKVHYYNTFSKEESFLIMFSPDIFPDYSKFLLNNDPVSPVMRKNALPAEVKQLLEKANEVFMGESPFKMEIVKGYFNIFLGTVLPCFEFKAVHSNNTDMLSSILAYCIENYKENISLDTMASDLHASKYYISRLFGEKIKISFNDYINMLRINDAKESLIKTDDSVTQIGINVGYNTIRSFNRAFLSQTGMQPRAYRNLYKNGNDSHPVNAKPSEQAEKIKNNDTAEESGVINISDDFECCF